LSILELLSICKGEEQGDWRRLKVRAERAEVVIEVRSWVSRGLMIEGRLGGVRGGAGGPAKNEEQLRHHCCSLELLPP
jgi:hypothetical protein